jgi:hypothetical protein
MGDKEHIFHEGKFLPLKTNWLADKFF